MSRLMCNRLEESLREIQNPILRSTIYYRLYENCEDMFLKEKYLIKGYKECKDNSLIINEGIKTGILLEYLQVDDYVKYDLNNLQYISRNKTIKEVGGELCVIGGGNKVGGSCYLLKFRGVNILLDCGITFTSGNEFINPNFNKIKDFGLDSINDIDLALISHSHLDHCGGIVQLHKETFSVPVYTTVESKILMGEMLNILYAGQEKKLSVSCAINNIDTMEFNSTKEFNIRNKTVSVTALRAGHILGAAMFKIEVDGYKILFTGDYSSFDQHTVKGGELDNIGEVHVIITESTYGNMKNKVEITRKTTEALFKREVKRLVNEGKKVLIPAFAFGRAQEVLSIMKNLNFPIYVDGEAKEICKIYGDITGEKYEKCIFIKSNEERKKLLNKIQNPDGICIVASSGMLHEGSASAVYGEQIVQKEDGVIILTGYQESESVGNKLKIIKNNKPYIGSQYIEINNKIHRVSCLIEDVNLSAHSNLNEIISLILHCEASQVILVHADAVKEERTILEEVLRQISGLKVIQSFNGENYKI